MKQGSWFLTYTYRDTFGGGLAGTIEHEEIELKGLIEKEVLEEAKAIWAKKCKEAVANWEKAKATWAHPPKTAFDDGPSNPCICYKRSL
jgi:hypothetical protein